MTLPEAPTATPPVSGPPPFWRGALRRRRFVVDGRYQVRTSVVAVSVASILLVLLNVSLFLGNGQATGQAGRSSPELRPFFEAQDRAQTGLVLTGSIVFLAGVFLVSLLETHRTAGAALHIGRALGRLRDGDTRVRVTLRRGDHLQDVAASFNAAVVALHEQAWQDTEKLEAIAARAEAGASVAEIGEELRKLAEDRRSRLH